MRLRIILIIGCSFLFFHSGNALSDEISDLNKKVEILQVTIDEFLVQAITHGSDDVGKVHMQVEYEGNFFHGFGANTDIITASVEAFLDAINKLPVAN